MTRKARIPARPSSPPVFGGPLSGRIGWRPLLIFALTVWAYASAISSPLLFDDQGSIVSNASIRLIMPLSGALSPPHETPVAGRPLVNLTLAINYAVNGLSVRGYHITNLALHVFVAFLLFGVIRRALALPRVQPALAAHADTLALSGALLWALHPLNSEVVNYLTRRTESLMGFFYLLTVYASIRALNKDVGLKWTATAIAACVAGMACNESMVTAPVMIAIVDRILVFTSWRESLWSRRGLYAGLAASWMVLGALLWSLPSTSAGVSSGISWWSYLLNQAQLIPRYLGLAFWPRALVLDYGIPRPLAFSDVLPGFALIAVLLVLTAVALWRWPKVGLLGAWFFITLAPASSVVPVALEVGAESRMYLPLMAIVLLVVLGVHALLGRPRASVGAPAVNAERAAAVLIPAVMLAVVCVLMITGITLRNREYRSTLTMAQTIVDRWPSGRGHFLLASELLAVGRHDEAMTQFREASKDFPTALFALGTELVAAGDLDAGVSALQRFITAQPNNTFVIPARETLSRVYLNQDRPDLAAEQLRLLLVRVPNHAGARRLMAEITGVPVPAAGR